MHWNVKEMYYILWMFINYTWLGCKDWQKEAPLMFTSILKLFFKFSVAQRPKVDSSRALILSKQLKQTDEGIISCLKCLAIGKARWGFLEVLW